MRLAICGTHFVGKTTLSEDLLEQLPGYELVMEPYYELESAGHEFSEIPELEDYISQFQHSVKRIADSGGDVIFDRCPIDLLAYIHATDPHLNIQTLFQMAQSAMAHIGLLVFVPVEKPDFRRQEGARLSKLRYAVNDILEDWVWDFNVRTMEVKGSRKERCGKVLAAVG